MTPEQAKAILSLYRPGSADDNDPAFAEALALANAPRHPGRWASQPDPELSRWFQEHCSAYLSVRGKLREIQPPAGLKDQILAEYKSHLTPAPARPRILAWSLAGALLAAIALTVFLVRRDQARDFRLYRDRVVAQALRRAYPMDIETNDLAAINQYLAGKHAPTESVLPRSLKSAQPVGCAVVDWHGKAVTMLCFRTGKPLEQYEVADLWLFIAQQNAVSHVPAGVARTDAQVDRIATAAWTQDGQLYVLGVLGDEGALRKYF
jgi:hypothetical protein